MEHRQAPTKDDSPSLFTCLQHVRKYGSAFLNSDGGVLMAGILDDGKLYCVNKQSFVSELSNQQQENNLCDHYVFTLH